MGLPKIKHVRALVAGGDSGADYHDKQGYHWIDDPYRHADGSNVAFARPYAR